MIDSYGKKWDASDELDNYLRKNKIGIIIEYISEPDKQSLLGHRVYFYLKVNKKKRTIITYKETMPLGDAEILSLIKSHLREEKLDKILKNN